MVPPPKEGPNKKLIGGIVAAVVILGGVGIGIALSGGKEATRLAEQIRTLLKWLINHRKKLKWKLKQAVRIPKNR